MGQLVPRSFQKTVVTRSRSGVVVSGVVVSGVVSDFVRDPNRRFESRVMSVRVCAPSLPYSGALSGRLRFESAAAAASGPCLRTGTAACASATIKVRQPSESDVLLMDLNSLDI